MFTRKDTNYRLNNSHKYTRFNEFLYTGFTIISQHIHIELLC
jgi:hypothetical protein